MTREETSVMVDEDLKAEVQRQLTEYELDTGITISFSELVNRLLEDYRDVELVGPRAVDAKGRVRIGTEHSGNSAVVAIVDEDSDELPDDRDDDLDLWRPKDHS